jgi:hypothetical protein
MKIVPKAGYECTQAGKNGPMRAKKAGTEILF